MQKPDNEMRDKGPSALIAPSMGPVRKTIVGFGVPFVIVVAFLAAIDIHGGAHIPLWAVLGAGVAVGVLGALILMD